MLLGVGILLEALNAEHAEHTVLRDQRQIDHRGGRLGGAAVFKRPARVLVGRNVLRIFGRTSLIRIGWRWSMHQTANWFLSSVLRV